jgi:tetratricopeptide (TPR) repeat protein
MDCGLRASPGLGAGVMAERSPWGDIPVDALPRTAKLEPMRVRRWPWVVLGLLAGAAAAVFFWAPRFDLQTLPDDITALIPAKESSTSTPASAVGSQEGSGATAAGSSAATPPTATAADSDSAVAMAATTATSTSSPATLNSGSVATETQLRAMREAFDSRLAMLESRGAGAWGGSDFAAAKTRAAESVGAYDAGNAALAQERLATAGRLLDSVESKAPQALTDQIAAGEKALGTGQQEVAGQAFQLARRIDPNSRRASDGVRRARSLNGVLPLLADAQNAEAAHDYARAAQDYSQALSLDPGNIQARAGQLRANTAFGDDTYAKAVGSGFAALGAGRLDQAHEWFVTARSLKTNGAEASEGLRRVSAALTARGFASMRQRAIGFEAQERWDEAERVYEDALSADPSLAFAQEGKARSSSRAELSGRLQELLDRPERLAAPAVRDDAQSLLETAKAQSPSGPVLRSQIARLEILLPSFNRPVRLALVSDNTTQVAISSIGSFGSFARRDIELKPGRYIVVGTRIGFRDVRREITVAPGQEIQTIRVSCSEPI